MMSSALAMVLMAAVAVPGNGPEVVSGEMEQGLDLQGRWESVEVNTPDGTWKVALENGEQLWNLRGELEFRWDCPITDEGHGHLKMRFAYSDYTGIYRQEGERLTICYRKAHRGRPVEYKEDIWTTLLILHRVKPRK